MKNLFVFLAVATILFSCGQEKTTQSDTDTTKACCKDSTMCDTTKVCHDSTTVDTSKVEK